MSEHFLQPPPLPEFLDRSKWSPERWERFEAANRALNTSIKKAEYHARKTADRKVKALRIEADARTARKDERKQLKADRRNRKEQRQADRQLVVDMIRSGRVTIGQMSKASGVEQPRLKSAIRWLTAQGRIAKASPRQYREIS